MGFSCSALFLNLSLDPLLARLETSTDCKLMAHTRLKSRLARLSLICLISKANIIMPRKHKYCSTYCFPASQTFKRKHNIASQWHCRLLATVCCHTLDSRCRGDLKSANSQNGRFDRSSSHLQKASPSNHLPPRFLCPDQCAQRCCGTIQKAPPEVQPRTHHKEQSEESQNDCGLSRKSRPWGFG